MIPEQWKRVEDLFESALGMAPGERGAFLSSACPEDEEVRAEVESLLGAGAEATGFLETPALALNTALPAEIARGDVLPDALIGEQVGAYRVVRRLGTGGMGVVYLAEQRSPSRAVALKLIRPGIATAQVLKRFEHESQVLGRLHHVGIAQIYEAGTARTAMGIQPFFAMEYVVGKPLLQHVAKLGVRERLSLLVRVCDAVQHAHSKGVIHRDIKPGNILVEEGAPADAVVELEGTASGTAGIGAGQPKILDFGVARITDADPQNATMRTEVGQLVGTLSYMSPEQVAPAGKGAAGEDVIDTRSDVYSLGVLAYEVLTGRLPYEVSGRAIHEAAREICETSPARPGVVNRSLRGDIETVLLKALEKDPARRYQSAAALGDDLRRVLLDQPILARPMSAAYQVRKFISRHRVLSGVVAGAFLLVVGFGVWMSVLYARADRLRGEAQEAWAAETAAHERAQESELLATRRAETAGKMLGVLVDAFRAVDPSMSASADINARDVVAREIVERGIRKIERELGDEPRIRAQLLASLGSTLGGLGYYDRAAALLREAIEARRNESDPPPVEVADYLKSLSRFLSQMGKDAAAREAMDESLSIYRAVLPADSPQIASALAGMAYLAVISGDVEEAERLCMESIRMHDKTPGHAGIVGAEPLNGLAGALSERGEYARAAEVLRRALDQVMKREHDPVRMEASLRMNLAWVLCMEGEYEEAEKEARWALESRLKQYPAGHARTTPPLLTLGLILTRTGRAAEGAGYIRQCVEIRKRATPDNKGSIAEAESALGECLTAQGKTEDAEGTLLTSLRALQADGDPSLETAQLGVQRLVWYYEKVGDTGKAAQYVALLRPPWDGAWVKGDAAREEGAR